MTFLRASAGWSHSLVLTTANLLLCRGDNSKHACGTGVATGNIIGLVPVNTSRMSNANIVAIQAGNGVSFALESNGKAFVWGMVYESIPYTIPTQVAIPEFVSAVSCIANHVLLLTLAGNVYTFGYNKNGEMGNGTTSTKQYISPWKLDLRGERATQVAASSPGGLILLQNMKMLAWGWQRIMVCPRSC